MRKQIFLVCVLFLSFNFCNAQLEGAYVTTKDYSALGIGGFLNFSIPVAQVNYITLDAGYQHFKNKNDEVMGIVPLLMGFRYTLDQTGKGWYVEPNAGYTFTVDPFGMDMEGASAGIGLGYLFDITNIPFNVGCRYEHIFQSPSGNVISLRISHALSF